MVTCHVRYVLDPAKVGEFETFCRMWIPITNRMGGVHHGYLLPSEGANNIALGSFSFPSLAAYEVFRQGMKEDPECQQAFRYAEETKCFFSVERSFFRPVFEG